MEDQLEVETPQTTTNENSEKEKKSLAKKTSHHIKNRVVTYINNLDPRGKDKFWWTGNILSAAGTAAIYVFSPAARPLKTLASVSLSAGLYAGEKATEKYRKNYWTQDQRAEWAAKRQEKFPNGVSRLKRFILGVSAGGIYGAALGIPLEIAHTHLASTSVKHATRYHERPITQTSH